MPISLITLVDVDRVWFKSRLGVDWTDVCRNDSFDAYTVNPDSSEVFVIPDVCADNRFKDCDLKCGKIPVRFYAGAAIIIDDVRIGSLCILDTVPHLDFSLEEKENLLDLCVGVSQLAQERRQHTLNLNADRANIVVSMMHNLRTPMTSLNFASSMLATEACKLRPAAKSKLRVGGDANALDEDDDNSDDGVGGGPTGGGTHGLLRTPSSAVGNPHLQTPSSRDHSPIPSVEQTVTDAEAASSSDSKGDSPIPPAGASSSAAGGVGVDAAVGAAAALAAVPVTLSATNIDNIESAFSTFDDCFREITSALKQLNLVVDSSLNLGQAIVKISEPPSNGQHGANCAGRDNLSSTSGGMSEKSGLALASACLSAVQSAVPSANVSAHTSPKGIVVKAGDSSSSSSSSAAGKPSGAVGGASAGLYPEMQNSRYVACNLLDHIESVYNTLISQVVGVNVSWEVNPAYFGLGRHASFPDAVSLVLISSLGQLRTPHKNIRIRFHFEKLEHPEDLEFPEIADKLIEGVLVIRIQAYSKQERAVPKSSPKRANAAEASSTNSSPQHGENAHSSMRESIDVSNKTSATSTSAALSAISNVSERLQHAAPEQGGEDHDYHSGYNLLSVNKVLRTVNGGCREYLEAIPQPPVKEPELGDLEDSRSNQTIEPPERMPTQHFWIPCKILPSADVLASLVGPGGVSFGGGLASAGSVDGGVQDTLVRHYNESGSALGRWDSVLSRSSRSNKLSGGESSSTKQDPEASSSTAPSSMKGVRIGTSPMSANLAKLGTDKEKIHTPMSGAGGVPIVPEGSIASNGVGCSSTNPPAVAGAGGAGVGAGERDPNRVLRALIIEDTLSVQKLLSRWMQKANCKVTCANNGSLGLNQLTSACFDIVFIDFLMVRFLCLSTNLSFFTCS